jgi:hypothetical protein
MKMNTNRIIASKWSVFIALLIMSMGVRATDETQTATVGAAQVIQLHAPNNATASVTVWTTKPAAPARNEAKKAKPGVARLVELHSPNNATPSVTVWPGKPVSTGVEVAPLK